jgi:hypothetical protein
MCIANLKCKVDNFMAFYNFNDNFLKILSLLTFLINIF